MAGLPVSVFLVRPFECSEKGRTKKIPSRTGSMQGADQAPKMSARLNLKDFKT
jgi:hypothetical protein